MAFKTQILLGFQTFRYFLLKYFVVNQYGKSKTQSAGKLCGKYNAGKPKLGSYDETSYAQLNGNTLATMPSI